MMYHMYKINTMRESIRKEIAFTLVIDEDILLIYIPELLGVSLQDPKDT